MSAKEGLLDGGHGNVRKLSFVCHRESCGAYCTNLPLRCCPCPLAVFSQTPAGVCQKLIGMQHTERRDIAWLTAELAIRSVRRLEGESIPDTGDSSEVAGASRIVLQLVPELQDVIVDATAGSVAVFIAANFLQQLCARDDAIGILNEKL